MFNEGPTNCESMQTKSFPKSDLFYMGQHNDWILIFLPVKFMKWMLSSMLFRLLSYTKDVLQGNQKWNYRLVSNWLYWTEIYFAGLIGFMTYINGLNGLYWWLNPFSPSSTNAYIMGCMVNDGPNIYFLGFFIRCQTSINHCG